MGTFFKIEKKFSQGDFKCDTLQLVRTLTFYELNLKITIIGNSIKSNVIYKKLLLIISQPKPLKLFMLMSEF